MIVEVGNKKCLGCDNLINSTTEKSYCSHSCYVRVWRIKNSIPKLTANCLCCGKPFIQKQVNSKHCSIDCRAKSIRLQKIGEIKEKTCENCGEIFLPKRNRNTKYCCSSCAAKAKYKKNPEKIKEATKINREKRKEMDEEAFLKKKRLNAKKNYSNQKWTAMKRKFGLSKEDYFSLIDSQNNRCKICNNMLLEGNSTHIDHCHETGKVRGILCFNCNVALGNFKDSIQNLYNAIHYLEQNK